MGSMVLDFEVSKIHKLPNAHESRVKAFADIVINNAVLIKGMRVVEGKNGLFVGMPCELGKNDRWYELVRCTNQDVKVELQDKVLQAYHRLP